MMPCLVGPRWSKNLSILHPYLRYLDDLDVKKMIQLSFGLGGARWQQTHPAGSAGMLPITMFVKLIIHKEINMIKGIWIAPKQIWMDYAHHPLTISPAHIDPGQFVGWRTVNAFPHILLTGYTVYRNIMRGFNMAVSCKPYYNHVTF